MARRIFFLVTSKKPWVDPTDGGRPHQVERLVEFTLRSPFQILHGSFDQVVKILDHAPLLADDPHEVPDVKQLQGRQTQPVVLGKEALALFDHELLHGNGFAGYALLV